MKKMEIDEFGILITREMKAMLLNSGISFENRAKIIVSIITGEKMNDPMMMAFADSLRTGFISTNNKRKAEILARRARQRGYQRRGDASTVDERASTYISVDTSTVDERSSTEMSEDERSSLNKAKQSKAKQSSNTPLPPEGEKGVPPEISIDDLMPGPNVMGQAEALAEDIEHTEAFAHMRVNRRRLVKCLILILKKYSREEILNGIAAWTPVWQESGWDPKKCPQYISAWLTDEKFKQPTPGVEYHRDDRMFDPDEGV